MSRQYGNKPRTKASMKASMEARIIMCTDERLADITVEDMQRNGFYRGEAEERLAAERAKRGLG